MVVRRLLMLRLQQQRGATHFIAIAVQRHQAL
jgi:hypothetical protein